jgi:hypothetical protein
VADLTGGGGGQNMIAGGRATPWHPLATGLAVSTFITSGNSIKLPLRRMLIVD